MDAQEFCLIRTLTVVGFDKGGRGHIHHLPRGTVLIITGRSSLPGFIEILRNDQVCHAFENDLQDRSQSAERALGAITV
jgi:hypothetical protein